MTSARVAEQSWLLRTKDGNHDTPVVRNSMAWLSKKEKEGADGLPVVLCDVKHQPE